MTIKQAPLFALICLAMIANHLRAEVKLGPDCVVRFASLSEAKSILGTEDTFVKRMTILDVQCRLRSPDKTEHSDYLEAAVEGAIQWTEQRKTLISPAVRRLAEVTRTYDLPVPKEILLICCDGKAELHAPHTRGNAIVLPVGTVDRNQNLLRLLAHELFHIVSRYSPELRDKLYSVIGFEKCGVLSLPREWSKQHFTNPDAPTVEHAIAVRVGTEEVLVTPLLLSKVERFTAGEQRSLFELTDLRFVKLKSVDNEARVETEPNGGIVRWQVDQLEGFEEQVGRNTRYIIHPEEIVADNFSYLLTGKRVPTKEIIIQIRRLLLQQKEDVRLNLDDG